MSSMTLYAWFIVILCFHDCSNFPKSYPRTFVNKLAVYRSSEDDGTDARDELDNKFPSSPSQMDRSDNPTTKTPKPASSSNDISVQFEDIISLLEDMQSKMPIASPVRNSINTINNVTNNEDVPTGESSKHDVIEVIRHIKEKITLLENALIQILPQMHNNGATSKQTNEQTSNEGKQDSEELTKDQNEAEATNKNQVK